jgi:hypothetical protein
MRREFIDPTLLRLPRVSLVEARNRSPGSGLQAHGRRAALEVGFSSGAVMTTLQYPKESAALRCM